MQRLSTRTVVAVGGIAAAAAAAWCYRPTATRSEPSSDDTTQASNSLLPSESLQVPNDVAWFVPSEDGWLCNYNYVLKQNGVMVLKFAPRNEGLGKILVLKPYGSRVFKLDQRRGHVNNFFQAWHSTKSKSLLLAGSEWVVVAVNQWGELDRMFVLVANFGDKAAFVRFVTEFTLGQEVPLRDGKFYQLGLAHTRFPGLVGTMETVVAYS